jgi:hypothetical protein
MLPLILFAVATVFALALSAYICEIGKRERDELVNKLIEKDRDLLDRLMAKSLQEAKEAQREPVPSKIISKRKNDARMMEEKRKLLEK